MFYRLRIILTQDKWVELTSDTDNYEDELRWYEHGTTRYLSITSDDNTTIIVDREAVLYMKRSESNGPF
jgi:hypothetical protein